MWVERGLVHLWVVLEWAWSEKVQGREVGEQQLLQHRWTGLVGEVSEAEGVGPNQLKMDPFMNTKLARAVDVYSHHNAHTCGWLLAVASLPSPLIWTPLIEISTPPDPLSPPVPVALSPVTSNVKPGATWTTVLPPMAVDR